MQSFAYLNILQIDILILFQCNIHTLPYTDIITKSTVEAFYIGIGSPKYLNQMDEQPIKPAVVLQPEEEN